MNFGEILIAKRVLLRILIPQLAFRNPHFQRSAIDIPTSEFNYPELKQ